MDEKKNGKQKPLFDSERVKVDKIDIEILNFLSKDARMKLIDLDEKVKLSSMLVHQRIKKLEKKAL